MASRQHIRLQYSRFHAPGHDDYESVDDAVGAAYWMRELGTGCPYRIEDLRDGSIIDHDIRIADLIERLGGES